MSVVGFDEALQIVRDHALDVLAPAAEPLPLLDALHRTLAEPVQADRDQPPFARSTRDGFAVQAAAFASGHPLRILGNLPAGQRWSGPALTPTDALRIMTGAPIPEGADAVAMIEFVQATETTLRGNPGRGLDPGENVVPRAAEARRGDPVLPAGTRIGPAEIALAAACGAATLSVFRRPTVAIVPTGDELVELASTSLPGDSSIWNSNSYALAALVTEAGAHPDRRPIAPDTLQAVQTAIAEARHADLLLLSGGVSMGDRDHVEAALAHAGADFFFTGVRMQPGKPVVFGRLPAGDTAPACFFFGLPGNPISTEVTFHCFVEPLLRALAGSIPQGPRFVQATLTDPVPPKPGLTRLLPARLTHHRDAPTVSLIGWQGSGDLAANARANCYAVLPPDREAFQAGDVISILLR